MVTLYLWPSIKMLFFRILYLKVEDTYINYYSAADIFELFWLEVSKIVKEAFWFCPGLHKIPFRTSEN